MWKENKGLDYSFHDNRISEMFTIEDEAFSLILVHNEVERWIDRLKDKILLYKY